MFSDIIKGYITAIKYMNYSSLNCESCSGSVMKDINSKYMYLFTKLYIESI